MRKLFLVIVPVLALFATPFPSRSADLPLDRIRLPPGFKISVLADNVPSAREMAFSPGGTLFVGSMKGNVYAIDLPGTNR